MARPLTGNEPALLASHGQKSKVYLAVKPMPVIFSAQVNQTVLSTDEMTSIIYDYEGDPGNIADVLPGMLLLVGTSPGGAEKGFLRIRIAPTSTVIYFGMTSEIAFEDDDYLTVVDDFPLVDKPAISIANLTTIDSTINYSDQHKYMDPVPIMGPLVAVVELVEASVSLTLEPGVSKVLGSTISVYAWTATGPAAVTITNNDSASPTLEFTEVGWYRLALTVTAANTKTSTGYRWVLVWDRDNAPALLSQQAAVDNPTGDSDSGVWEFNANLWDHADLANVADRALVVLFAEDWYGDTKQSIGPIPGWENVIACGWIAGETIDWNPRAGSVKFTVRGPAWWLQQIDTQTVTIKNIDGSAPTTWDQIEDLDVDKALWHVARWRSTITAIIDIFLPGDTTLALSLDGGLGSVWDALKNIAKRIGAAPICDRYGRIFIQVDPQLTPVADRDDIPVVMDIPKASWQESIQFEKRLVKATSIVELSAVSFDGTTSTQIWSRAPGNLSGTYGRPEPVDGYIVADQAKANELSGLVLAQKNNPNLVVPLKIAANNRMIDIAPVQYLTQSIASGDTKRGINWSTRRLIPRRIQIVINNKTGSIHPEIEAEMDTSGSGITIPPDGVPYIPPVNVVPNIPIPPTLPNYPITPPDNTDFPDFTWPNPDIGPTILECANDWYAPRNEYPLSFSRDMVQAGENITAALPCTLRDEDTYNGPSYLQVGGYYDGDSLAEAVVTGTNGGSDVATAVNLPGTIGEFVFHLPGPVAVTGFKIALPSGSGLSYQLGSRISSGNVAANNNAGVEITGLTIGQWYAIDGWGGPWYPHLRPTEIHYDYIIGKADQSAWSVGEGYNGYYGIFGYGPVGWTSSHIEQINNGYYARTYFLAIETSVRFQAMTIGDATAIGSLGWILSEAIVTSDRKMRSISASIHNICA
jgi:hypothetical protein